MEAVGMMRQSGPQQESRKLWQYLATCSACLMAFAVGTALAWTSPVLPQFAPTNSTSNTTLNTTSNTASNATSDSRLIISEEEGSWISSLLAIGAIIGAIPAGSLADKLGRKKGILSLSVPFFVSWIMIILASSVWLFYVARLIVGIAVGAACVVVPTYVSEIAETSSRGTLGSLFQLFITIGIVLTFVIGSVVSYIGLSIACAMVEVLLVATFIWMPESPTWFVAQGRKADAVKSLEVLRGDSYDISEELASIQKAAEEQASRKSSPFAVIKTRGSRRALISSLGTMAFQQLSGINAVIFYTVNIFKAAGSTMEPSLAAIAVASVQMVMSGVAAVIIDKAGKKPLLIFSSAVTACCLIAIAFYFKLLEGNSDVSKLGWLPLTSLVIFMMAFSVGLGPIPWMLTGELFTVETKPIASSLAVMTNWGLVFLVTKTFPTMKTQFGSAITFSIFAIIMGISAVFSFFIVPETKGKTLEAIQHKLHRKRRRNIA
ncbi:facilitated trehalose transporter Tret1 [Cephus cinctus]|uniref:Facilitated trehalose transporter Tret1 n=1 Tax=Cephus cinctus TaxID=211228 RepID=A0AAJ7BYM0_CEPCN|nr:facilitated trehalose transporter Tret1 [Cephus cinctus]